MQAALAARTTSTHRDRPCELTRSSALAYNAAVDSSVRAASNIMVVFIVRLSRPGLHQHTGRTCLHELFIEYEQVTAWEARFSLPTNWRQIIIYCQSPSALDGSMDRRTSRRHYSLVNLQTARWKEPLAELLTRLIGDHL